MEADEIEKELLRERGNRKSKDGKKTSLHNLSIQDMSCFNPYENMPIEKIQTTGPKQFERTPLNLLLGGDELQILDMEEKLSKNIQTSESGQ